MHMIFEIDEIKIRDKFLKIALEENLEILLGYRNFNSSLPH